MWLPRYKTLALPTGCSLSCNGCPVWQNNPPELIDSIPDLQEYRHGIVHITGGDPLLHKHLPGILQTLKRQENFVILTTPGLRLSQLDPAFLKYIDLIFLYMPGYDTESIREATGFDTYAQYYLTLSSLAEQKRKVIVTYPLTPETVPTLPDIYNLVTRLKQYLFLPQNRIFGTIPREYTAYYRRRRNVVTYAYTDYEQKTCLGCPHKLWRLHPLSLGTLLQGFYKLYL